MMASNSSLSWSNSKDIVSGKLMAINIWLVSGIQGISYKVPSGISWIKVVDIAVEWTQQGSYHLEDKLYSAMLILERSEEPIF